MTARRCAVAPVVVLALVLALLGAGAGVGAAQSAAPLDPSPSGSNDWSCRPSAAHPEPVVLVHGLSANQANNWAFMAPLIKRAGYCVFSLTYGRNPLAPPPLSQVGGLVPMEQSAQELKAFVDRVRSATGAAKVDIFGHSEGSLMPDYYVKFLGGAAAVHRYVGMTPLWDGTRLAEANVLDQVGQRLKLDPAYGPAFAAFCGSCREFLHGSDFLAKLSSGGTPAVAGVTYTTIMTSHDELVIPYTSGVLRGGDTTNVVLQDVCPADPSEHLAVAYDPAVEQIVLNALDPGGAQKVRCTGPPR